jgi:hypothetical protein
VWRASTQNGGGKVAWRRIVRTMSLVVRMSRSALPFCGGVWAGQAEANTMFGKIIAKSVCEEFATVVTLQAFNSNVKLSGNIMEETFKSNTSVRFISQRKGP